MDFSDTPRIFGMGISEYSGHKNHLLKRPRHITC